MVDVVSPQVRSRMMAGIRGKNTKPELMVRRGLHARGFRYVLHDKRLPGRPDLVFPKHRAVLFVHGCFWHGHDCHLFKWPNTRKDFWRKKIERNREIDQDVIVSIRNSGWRYGAVWECALKGASRRSLDSIIDQCSRWLVSSRRYLQVRGK
ncbi:DNA mismatch endonuclease Vsr [Bradyrhizobium diazoefficiens]|nr:very short patch repair endonuclease [Bradyrhizobium diazoefficiens]MBR0852007.1 DNA mismatch endonuclease Vsr [Bradyrhizobium diazoefficiens]